MIEIPQSAAIVAGAMLALLLFCGTWMLFAGLRIRAEARETAHREARLTALVAGSPAQAMVVRADGRVEVPRRLADWLGLDLMPRELSDLAGIENGLVAADAAALSEHVLAAQKAGQPFSLSVRAQGSERALLVIGERAGEAMHAPGGVVL